MEIAIIEDDKTESERIKSYVQKFMDQHGVRCRIYAYTNAESFLDQAKLSQMDLVFFDIRLPGIDGLTAAAKFREQNKPAVLIFITNMTQFAIRGYEVDASDYILKPLIYADFEFKMRRIFPKLAYAARSADTITVKSTTGTYRIELNKLAYVEIIQHKLFYHTTEGIIEVNDSLSHIEKELLERGMIKCNRCYLVNPELITEIHGKTISVLGEKLQISQPRKKQFYKDFDEWIAKNGGRT